MTTLKGFLGGNDDDKPQMTPGQKSKVILGAKAALFAAFPPTAAAGLYATVVSAVESVPDSRACACCDFFNGDGWCSEWQSEVPADVQRAGCDRFKDEGAPF